MITIFLQNDHVEEIECGELSACGSPHLASTRAQTVLVHMLSYQGTLPQLEKERSWGNVRAQEAHVNSL
jgi:hypothetical protein